MTPSDNYWHYTDKKQAALADKIIGLEQQALHKFFNGDMSGYRRLWSDSDFTYFDALVTKRVESLAGMNDFLNRLEGHLKADYQFVNPRVQFGKDMAVLTFQLFAKSQYNDMQYNCVEVFRKEDNGEWHVIHSTWSTIRPMDKYGKNCDGKETVI